MTTPKATNTKQQYDIRDLSTILAALRLWQHHLDGTKPWQEGLADIADNGGEIQPMSVDEIGDLCQRLNFGGLCQ